MTILVVILRVIRLNNADGGSPQRLTEIPQLLVRQLDMLTT